MQKISSRLFSGLRELQDKTKVTEPKEFCDFCREEIPSSHRHFMDIVQTQVMCACQMCTILQSLHARYKLIPQTVSKLHTFSMPDDIWSDFLIPVNVAFFVHSSAKEGVVAYYPAAAGAVESKLKMQSWDNLRKLNPVLATLKPDVEALLLNRLGEQQHYYKVPVDKCYELVGTLKMNWKGIFGGKEVQDAIHIFFNELNTHANARA